MGMTSSTWNFDSDLSLIGCGIDAENIHRFARILQDDFPQFPLVFTKREIQFILKTPFPEKSMCACFCCKEAVFKALGEPYNFIECELFPDFNQDFNKIHLSPAILKKNQIKKSFCVIKPAIGNNEELVVLAYLFG